MEAYNSYTNKHRNLCWVIFLLNILGAMLVCCGVLLCITTNNSALVSLLGGFFIAAFFALCEIYRRLHKQFKERTSEILAKVKKYEELPTDFEKRNTAPEVVQSLLSWGYEISKVIRTNQTYDFVMEDSKFKDGKHAVKITGTHVYTVVNKSQNDSLVIPIDMKDELGLQSAEVGWGFESIFYTISCEQRKEYPLKLADSGDGAKKNVKFPVIVPQGKSVEFEFVSAGVFLPSDRYVWYSQDFCENCVISITNNTTISTIHRYQINHRDEGKILSNLKFINNPHIIDIDKESKIFPREGFTMYWKQIEA